MPWRGDHRPAVPAKQDVQKLAWRDTPAAWSGQADKAARHRLLGPKPQRAAIGLIGSRVSESRDRAASTRNICTTQTGIIPVASGNDHLPALQRQRGAEPPAARTFEGHNKVTRHGERHDAAQVVSHERQRQVDPGAPNVNCTEGNATTSIARGPFGGKRGEIGISAKACPLICALSASAKPFGKVFQ